MSKQAFTHLVGFRLGVYRPGKRAYPITILYGNDGSEWTVKELAKHVGVTDAGIRGRIKRYGLHSPYILMRAVPREAYEQTEPDGPTDIRNPNQTNTGFSDKVKAEETTGDGLNRTTYCIRKHVRCKNYSRCQDQRVDYTYGLTSEKWQKPEGDCYEEEGITVDRRSSFGTARVVK